MMKDIGSSLPSAEEILRAIGLQSRNNSQSEVVPGLALFGAGILVGAGLALLFTPTTGRQLREGIGEQASALRDRVASELHGGDAQEQADSRVHN
jgi:gas vesicle protein